jgi:hypothetical protein
LVIDLGDFPRPGILGARIAAAPDEDFTFSLLPEPRRWTMRYVAMQQERPRLHLRNAEQGPVEVRLALVASAIRNKVSLRARYNGQIMLIAPQILFTRHGAPHVDAMVLERDGRRDEELRLRSFNLSGLHELTTSGLHFELHAADLDDEKYAGPGISVVAAASGGEGAAKPALFRDC